MKSLIALTLILTVSASAAVAATQDDTTATAPVEKKKKPKKICKNDPRITGTRIAKRICKTEDEWNKPEDGQEVSVKSQAS
jgi:hypothetical protein